MKKPYRTKDPKKIQKATNQYAEKIEGFDPEDWVQNEENVALINEKGDVSLFERDSPSVVSGHYFFFSRGNEAVSVAKAMLTEIFSGPYNVKAVKGLTPLENLGARWVNRKLGFKEYGVIHTTLGPHLLVIMTKDEWTDKEDQ